MKGFFYSNLKGGMATFATVSGLDIETMVEFGVNKASSKPHGCEFLGAHLAHAKKTNKKISAFMLVSMTKMESC